MRQPKKRARPASADQFRLLVEQAAIGLQQVSAEGIIIEANHALCTRLGYSPDELVGRPYLELLDPEYRAASLERHQELFSGAIANYTLETRYLRKDGSPV
ncbi:MAG TPA: PAS domain S-box protein, partial [Stellaceae bacterium]|nr:PAS domain S-box protein [Stellaceae bacterium]